MASRWAYISRNFHPVSTCSSGIGGGAGAKALARRCSRTPESLPIEYSITGRSKPAAVSRRISTASASSRAQVRAQGGAELEGERHAELPRGTRALLVRRPARSGKGGCVAGMRVFLKSKTLPVRQAATGLQTKWGAPHRSWLAAAGGMG